MEKADLYLKLFQEYVSEARHHEQQRTTVTGFFSALAAGVLTVVGIDKQLSITDIPAAAFLVALGLFGCVFSAKQYERSSACMERARQYRRALEETVPGSNILGLKRAADIETKKRFPRLHDLRLWHFWVLLHALIAALGILVVALCGAAIHSCPK